MLCNLGSSPDSNKYDLALVGIFTVRYVLLWIMAALSAVQCRRDSKDDDLDALRALDPGAPEVLAGIPSSSTKPGAYGTFTAAFISPKDNGNDTNKPMGSSDAEIQQKLKTEQEERAGAFKDFWPKIKRLIPLVYPKDDTWLQFMIFLTFVFLVLGRVVNVLVPSQIDRVVSRLYTDDRKYLGCSIQLDQSP